MRAPRPVSILLAFLLAIAGVTAAASSASATDTPPGAVDWDGWNSVGNAVVTAQPDLEAYLVKVSADATFKPSVGLADTPDPIVDWGDGSWERISAHTDACDKLEFSCLYDTDAMEGGHLYKKSGPYHITMRYYTGRFVWYEATWDISIPRTTSTINISTSGFGFGTVTYSPKPINGGTVCPPDCAPKWQDGTKVTITAVPKVGSAYDKFQKVGPNCSPFGCTGNPCNTNPCTVTMKLIDGWSLDLRTWFYKTDVTPPDLFAFAATEDGENYTAGTWTNQPVTVRYFCVDQHSDASGIETNTIAGATISTEGANQSVTNTGSCIDYAANAAVPVTFGPINIDTTAPTVTWSGNAGSYTADQMVSITCTANDNLSGVASSTCKDITGPAYSFLTSPRVNTYEATASDVAGNAMSAPTSTSFTVTVNAAATGAVINRLVTNGGVASALGSQATAVAKAPNANAKAGKLGAFINHINAQTGKSITPANAAVLISLAKQL